MTPVTVTIRRPVATVNPTWSRPVATDISIDNWLLIGYLIKFNNDYCVRLYISYNNWAVQ